MFASLSKPQDVVALEGDLQILPNRFDVVARCSQAGRRNNTMCGDTVFKQNDPYDSNIIHL
jgi:hypothetical protein